MKIKSRDMIFWIAVIYLTIFSGISYGLEKEFREVLYSDFEQLTLEFFQKGNLYGLEKYW